MEFEELKSMLQSITAEATAIETAMKKEGRIVGIPLSSTPGREEDELKKISTETKRVVCIAHDAICRTLEEEQG